MWVSNKVKMTPKINLVAKTGRIFLLEKPLMRGGKGERRSEKEGAVVVGGGEWDSGRRKRIPEGKKMNKINKTLFSFLFSLFSFLFSLFSFLFSLFSFLFSLFSFLFSLFSFLFSLSLFSFSPFLLFSSFPPSFFTLSSAPSHKPKQFNKERAQAIQAARE